MSRQAGIRTALIRGDWPAFAAFAIASAALLFVFWADWTSMVALWRSDPTFSHAALIAPLSLYLIWSKRRILQAVPIRGSWLGVGLLVVAGLIWIVGDVLKVAVLGHFSIVLMLQALVLVCFGVEVFAALLFPLLYLFFMVPAGKAVVPLLMESTADLAMLLSRLTGVPVIREGMYLQIPAGTFEVATACSGVKFLVAAAALSTFYAHLMYTSWRKRVSFVVAFLVVAVLMNGFRAYFLVMLGHVTNMSWGHEKWHVPLGWLMFAVTILLMLRIGSRYADVPEETSPRPSVPADCDAGRYALLTIASLVALAAAPVTTNMLGRPVAPAAVQALMVPPIAQPPWRLQPELVPWKPFYAGALAEAGHSYVSGDRIVDLYLGTYHISAGEGGEMIAYHNRIQASANDSLFVKRRRAVALGQGPGIIVMETEDPGARPRLVWYWYQIGDRIALRPFAGKMLELLALARGERLERVVVLSAQADDVEGARAILAEFVQDHSSYFAQFAR